MTSLYHRSRRIVRWTLLAAGFVSLLSSGVAFGDGRSDTTTLGYPDSYLLTASALMDDQAAPSDASATTAEAVADECCPCDCQNEFRCDCCGLGLGCLDSLIQPSDHCYDDFISPMTNPVYFEDPRNLTEFRPIFINHKVPLTAGGGDIQAYAPQLRASLTDRLSVIATKAGYIVSDNPVVGDGWADIAVGVKYLLYSDPCCQRLASASVLYELPIGTPDARQGNGDGTFSLSLSGGALLTRDSHWIGGGGLVLPVDDNAESTWCYISNHFDYEFYSRFYALMEFNWYHWMESGDNGIPGIEGGDLFNFGSTGVAGNDIVSGAFGVKYKPSCHQEIGVAWELPLTERRDVLENRLTVDWIFRY